MYKKCVKFINVKFFFLFILFSTTSLVYAEKKIYWEPFLNLYKNGDCKELVRQLKPLTNLLSKENKDIWNRSQILKAKCDIEIGNYNQAIKTLNQIKESEFLDASIFQKIQAFLKFKKHKKAIKNIRKLLKHSKQKFYLPHLRDNIKKEFKSDQEALIIFPLLNETKNNYEWFLKDFQIHSIYLRGAKLNGIKLKPKYRLLGWQFPSDEKTAQQSHKKLTKNDLKNITSTHILNRVRTLSRLNENKYLINHLPQLIENVDKKTRKKLGEAYLEALFDELFYSRIINLYKKGTLTKKWNIPNEVQLYWVAISYIKRKNISEGRSKIYKIERKNSKDKRLPKLFDAIATRYMLDSEIEKAQFWWKRLINNFPKNRLTPKSTWRLAWTHLQKKNIDKSIFYINKGLKSKIYNSEMKAKLLYWQGKLYQTTGKNELAKKSFKKLIQNQPNTYYGMRLLSSSETLKSVIELNKSRKANIYSEPKGQLSKKTKELLRRTEFLFDIAESEQAVDELFFGLGRYKNSKLNWQVSHLLNRRGEHHPLLRVIANYYLPRMIKLEVGDSPLWKLAYPRPYWSLLKNYANQAGIDPYFALSIMREESHFDPQALSSSKAIGLMQLMPATAKEMAKRKKIDLKEKDEIYNPELNTKLGTFYLGRLAEKFQSELIYTAGSYNAGPHNMIKWINRWDGESLDAFVEQIPFKETRNYVKRVYRTYKIYKQIYSS